MSRRSWSAVASLGFWLSMVLLAGCGKEDELPDGVTLVQGDASFGTQCPYGTYSEPFKTPLEAWECPVREKLTLSEVPQQIVLQADCKKKVIVVRTPDRKLDSAWEVMPDGSFYFTVEPGSIGLATDGAGHSNCISYVTADIWGTLDCKDRDKVNITADVVWWPGKGKKPATPTGTECALPASCYFHAQTTLSQCQ